MTLTTAQQAVDRARRARGGRTHDDRAPAHARGGLPLTVVSRINRGGH